MAFILTIICLLPVVAAFWVVVWAVWSCYVPMKEEPNDSRWWWGRRRPGPFRDVEG